MTPKMEQHLSPILGKWKRKLFELKKNESKTLKSFQNYYSRWSRALSTITAGRARAVKVEEMYLLNENWNLAPLSENTVAITR